MITGLRGAVSGRGESHVDIDVGGVVYRANVSLTTLADLPPEGQPSQLLIHMIVREDALTLYGFSTEEERQTFQRLLAVQGVGARVALSVLGVPIDQLVRAVADEDIAFLKRIPNVGPKTAGRIIVELRDRLPSIARWSPSSGSNGRPAGPSARTELSAALAQLGYRPNEIKPVVTDLKARIDAGEPLDDLVRDALARLTGGGP